jgi:hypothetical protein
VTGEPATGRAHRPVLKTSLAVVAIIGVLAVAAVVVVPKLTHTSSPYSSICVYPRESTAVLQSIDELTGHEFTCVTVYDNANSTWAQWEQPWFASTSIVDWQWARWVRQASDRRLILTLSLVPSDAPANWRQVCAEGSYDSHARDLGENLVAEGLSDSVIRLAPEANNTLTGTASVGTTPAQVLAWPHCWAQVARSMRVPGSSFRFDWTVNAGYRDVPFATYYPGNAVVDIIGIDQYDALVDGHQVPPGPARWRQLASQPGGLDALVAFAREHGKPIGIGEWGEVGPPVPGGGGDDPYYISSMAALFGRVHVAYESYFDKSEGGTLTLGQVPNSLVAYRISVLGLYG